MKTILVTMVLAYLSFEVRGQDNDYDKIMAIFGANDTDVVRKNPVVPKPDEKDNFQDKINKIFGFNKTDVIDKNPVLKPNGCECVPYYLCNENNSIITDGTGLINIRQEGVCGSYLETCCTPPNKTTDPIKPTPGPLKPCGYRNPYGFGFRIQGDEDSETQFGEFPWMVAVLVEEFNAGTHNKSEVYKCGGTLIHPQVVLTAAHCVHSRSKKYKIRAGEWDTQTTKELVPHQDRYVKTIVIHDKYYAGAFLNDIAILFLDSPLDITETVNTLCLPDQDFVVPSGTRCVVIGWGKKIFGKEGVRQVILKKIELPIVERNTCEAQLKKTILDQHFQLDKSTICAGGEPGKNACKGDGGGPLAFPIAGEEDRYQHIGMVSWGIDCGENQVPGAFVNVPLFRKWIDEQIKNRGYRTEQT